MNLINADCLDEMKNIPDKSIDLIFCDLPYGITTCKWDNKIDLNKFWIQIKRIRNDNTPIFFTTTTKYGIDLINSNRKEFRYDLIWIKSCPVGFLNARKMPMRKHEMLYVFYKRLPYYDLSSHKHKFKNSHKIIPAIDKKYKNKGGIYCKNNIKRLGELKAEPLYNPPLPTTLLHIKSTKGKHKTEKPINLMKWILKYYSKEGDTILDPAMGSASMGVAANQMNRKFIGIEKDKTIYDNAVKRLNALHK